MKTFFPILFLVIFISLGSFAQNADLQNIRESFRIASKTEQQAEDFHKLMQEEDSTVDENLHKAYQGASEAILAKFTAVGSGKIKSAKQGKKHIEAAVENDNENLEIRLVRLIIQENSPKIAGYKDNIEEDKNFIIQNFKSADENVRQYLKKVLQETGFFNEQEFNQLD